MGKLLLPRKFYDDVQGLAPLGAPSTQAANIVTYTISQTYMQIGWTRGDGDGCVVVVRASTSAPLTPSNNTKFTANAQFGLGTDIGSGTFVCYIGTGNYLELTGLQTYTRYNIKVAEYNGSVPDYSAIFKASGFVTGTNPRLLRSQA